MAQNPVQTLVIDKFGTGPMTIYQDGDINSGRAYLQSTGGYNPYVYPGKLSWCAANEQIDPNGSVITDLVLAGKTRIESGVTYVYAIGHTGRFYKIQVNDPTTYDPNYDNPVLLATLSSNSPTFTRGAFMEFYGATERVYIGHDKGVTQIDFSGSNETFVGSTMSWVQNVPRPIEPYLGKLYVGNGANIAEIDTTLTVTSYTKLSPGFPSNSQVRDLDSTSEGNYLQAVVNRTALPDILSSTQDTTSSIPSESYVFLWNGTDAGYTSYTTYPGVSLTSNMIFQGYQYLTGSDMTGQSTFNPLEKVIPGPEVQPVLPGAITNVGGVVMHIAPLIFDGVLEADLYAWGTYDYERVNGYHDIFYFNAGGDETDVTLTPMLLPVANTGFGSSSNGYSGSQYSAAKYYISALETSSSTTAYKLYKWQPVFTPLDENISAQLDSIYQTQNQMFSKKVQIKQVRVYGQPWVANNSFTIQLIGSSGSPMTNGEKTFAIGSGLTVGEDFAYWTPQVAPTYTLGVAIINKGTVNHVIDKIEIDYAAGGL